MDARLVVVGGKASRSEIKLKLPALIGRKRESGVMIDHKSVSRQHCEIFARDGYLYVKDRNSSNGTFINDQRISEAILNPGDALRIGPLTFTAAYIPAPPTTLAGDGGHDAGDALMSDAPIEDSDFAGFFDGGTPADGDPFPAPLRNHPRGDALGDGDESDAFGWLGAEASGNFQRPSLSGIAPPELPPAGPSMTAAPHTLPEDEPTFEDDHTFEDDVVDDLPPPADPAVADEFVAGEPILEMEELLDADAADSGLSNAVEVEKLAAPSVEERSVFASLESPSIDLGPNANDEAMGFLGKFDQGWSEESGGPSDELQLGIEPGTTPGDPSSHGDWAVEKKRPGEDTYNGGEPTVKGDDPFADPAPGAASISLNGQTTESPDSFADDWSKTSLEPVRQNPLEGLDLGFDEIEQPSVEPRSASDPAPNDASAALAAAAMAEAGLAETGLSEAALAAAAAPPPDAPPESELEAPQTTDPSAPPQWAPSDEDEAPSLDLSDDDSPILEMVDDDEELLELELMDDGAEPPEDGEADADADADSEPVVENATDVDEELELEVIDESQEAAFDSGASPFDEPRKD